MKEKLDEFLKELTGAGLSARELRDLKRTFRDEANRIIKETVGTPESRRLRRAEKKLRAAAEEVQKIKEANAGSSE